MTGTAPSYGFEFVFRLPTAVFFLVFLIFGELLVLFLYFVHLCVLLPGRVLSTGGDEGGNVGGRRGAHGTIVMQSTSYEIPRPIFSGNAFVSSALKDLFPLRLLCAIPSFDGADPKLRHAVIFGIIPSIRPGKWSTPIGSYRQTVVSSSRTIERVGRCPYSLL